MFFLLLLPFIWLFSPPPVSAQILNLNSVSSSYVRLTQFSFQNLVSTFVQDSLVIIGVVFLGFILYGGLKWIFSQGDKDKLAGASKIISGALTGLVIAFSIFMLLRLLSIAFNENLFHICIPALGDTCPIVPLPTLPAIAPGGNPNIGALCPINHSCPCGGNATGAFAQDGVTAQGADACYTCSGTSGWVQLNPTTYPYPSACSTPITCGVCNNNCLADTQACYNNSSCCSGYCSTSLRCAPAPTPTPTHTICDNSNQCQTVAGAGISQCGVNNDCIGPDKHLACLGNTCLIAPGPGPNSCFPLSSSCSNSTSHLECSSSTGICNEVAGAGTNSCTDLGATCYASPPKEILYYAFNDGSGNTAVDSSGNGLTGTLGSSAQYTTQQGCGGAVFFDGTSKGYVQAPAQTSNGDFNSPSFTYAAWINPTQKADLSSRFGYIIDVDRPLNFYLYPYTHRLKFTASWDNIPGVNCLNGFMHSAEITSSQSIPDHTWTHVAVTYDAVTSTATIYINGVPDGSTTMSPPDIYCDGRTVTVGISDSFYDGFIGLIDEARLYNYALTANQLNALYHFCTPTTSTQIVLNSATGLSCRSVCANQGQVAVSVGYDSSATNGYSYGTYLGNCQAYPSDTNTQMLGSSATCSNGSESHKTDWGYCACQK